MYRSLGASSGLQLPACNVDRQCHSEQTPLCRTLCWAEAVAHYVGEGDVEAAARYGEARHSVLPRGPRADERDQVDAAQHRLALEQHVEHALLRRREKVLRLPRRPPVGQGGAGRRAACATAEPLAAESTLVLAKKDKVRCQDAQKTRPPLALC